MMSKLEPTRYSEAVDDYWRRNFWGRDGPPEGQPRKLPDGWKVPPGHNAMLEAAEAEKQQSKAQSIQERNLAQLRQMDAVKRAAVERARAAKERAVQREGQKPWRREQSIQAWKEEGKMYETKSRATVGELRKEEAMSIICGKARVLQEQHREQAKVWPREAMEESKHC